MGERVIWDEPDRVVMRGDWVEELVLDVAWSETDHYDEFTSSYDLDDEDYFAEKRLYQGMKYTRLMRRKSDGRLFGYPYWSSPGNDAYETQIDSNGEDHGFTYDWDNDADDVMTSLGVGPVYVWLPVKPLAITGYVIALSPTNDSPREPEPT